MKIRNDFVTNSSSSSFIVVAKIDVSDELKAYLKEEYGKHGLKMLEAGLYKGRSVIEGVENEGFHYNTLEELDFDEDTYYYIAEYYTYTDDGEYDEKGWLLDKIPEKYKEKVFSGENDY